MAKPAYSFTVPSIEDDTQLACRIYHPKSLGVVPKDANAPGAPLKGAVIAHPYAPLGGCFDDPVVLCSAEILLEQGYIVGTFNFRGAGESKGKTTWTGRAEKDDYASVAGLMIYYLHRLQPQGEPTRLATTGSTAADVAEQGIESPPSSIKLLLAGYSYGSLTLSRLPPVTAIIKRFEEAERGTAAAEIVLRARRLAQESTEAIREAQSPASPRGRQLAPEDAGSSHPAHQHVSPVTVGGEETDPSERRRSRDSRRSADIVRKGAEMPQRIKAHIRRHSSGVKDGRGAKQPSPAKFAASESMPQVSASYLLISPLLPPVSHALCPPSSMSALFGKAEAEPSTGVGALQYPTLAIWGASDPFTSSKKLRAWAEKLSRESAGAFEWAQIEKAGHFWREDGVVESLQGRIAAWLKAG